MDIYIVQISLCFIDGSIDVIFFYFQWNLLFFCIYSGSYSGNKLWCIDFDLQWLDVVGWDSEQFGR